MNLQSFNSHLADRLAVTSYSFGVNLGVYVLCASHLGGSASATDGQLRPQEYQCDLRRAFWKTIEQPESSRPDIWFVRPDGSNLGEVVGDASSVLLGEGMAWLDEFSDLRRIYDFASNEPEQWDSEAQLFNGTWGPGKLGSPARAQLIADLADALPTRTSEA